MFLSDCYSDDSVISTTSDLNKDIVLQRNTKMTLVTDTLLKVVL